MNERKLPPDTQMYEAMTTRDTRYEGVFVTAVKTTGIFCRPSCAARKPKQENVEFFSSARDALAHGYRPCKRCRPLEMRGRTPEPIAQLLREIEQQPLHRFRDHELRARGLNPATVRRWFNEHHGMTFHAYQRVRRLAGAIGDLARGVPITSAAFDNGYESLSGFQDALSRITGRSPSLSRDSTVVHLSRVLTPLGPMLSGATTRGVCLLEFTDRPMLETQLRRLSHRLDCLYVPGANEIVEHLASEIEQYFAGRLQAFRTPVHTLGSAFQQDVWNALCAIPYGATRSYADVARMIGAPHAVRAVARANGDNRIAIVIPCHRVIGADGKLTGYGGGLWRKRWLLRHESQASAGWPIDGRALAQAEGQALAR